jgi:hypothetical protein
MLNKQFFPLSHTPAAISPPKRFNDLTETEKLFAVCTAAENLALVNIQPLRTLYEKGNPLVDCYYLNGLLQATVIIDSGNRAFYQLIFDNLNSLL